MEFYEPRFFEYHDEQEHRIQYIFLTLLGELVVGKDIRRKKFSMMLEHFITYGIQLDVDRCIPFEQVQFAIELIESKSSDLTWKNHIDPDVVGSG